MILTHTYRDDFFFLHQNRNFSYKVNFKGCSSTFQFLLLDIIQNEPLQA